MIEPFKKSKTSNILYRAIPRGEYSHYYDPRYSRTFELKDNPKGKGYSSVTVPSQKYQREMAISLWESSIFKIYRRYMTLNALAH